MTETQVASTATLNRLSVYLRCLRELLRDGYETVSSQELADRFHFSSAQIRKDLAQFGDFGIRGVGYQIEPLVERLHSLLGLDQKRPIVIVGMGALGNALAGYIHFNDDSFEVVAGFDNDPQKVGRELRGIPIRDITALPEVLAETGAEIAVLTVPAEAAAECYEALADAGIRAILNFAPVPLPDRGSVRLKNVDLRTYLEETSFLLRTLP
ncbi:MAG: redox-sensing transcriptional repressor Rex [Thermoanaerobaculia bacterium]|nr:redox-sensing transcriptional repressor Rex [Thermoanaerobaculia bacterium]